MYEALRCMICMLFSCSLSLSFLHDTNHVLYRYICRNGRRVQHVLLPCRLGSFVSLSLCHSLLLPTRMYEMREHTHHPTRFHLQQSKALQCSSKRAFATSPAQPAFFFFDNPISPSSEGGVTIVSGADNKKKRNAKIKEKRRKKQKTNKAGGGFDKQEQTKRKLILKY